MPHVRTSWVMSRRAMAVSDCSGWDAARLLVVDHLGEGGFEAVGDGGS